MAEKKSLDQIVNDTLNSNFGISDADLQALFEDTAAEAALVPTTVPATPTVEPVNLPPAVTTPIVPAIVAPPVVVPESTQVVTSSPKSLDLESSLKAANDKLASLNIIVQELLKKSQTSPTDATIVTPSNPLDEVDDQAIIERPKESIVKMVPPLVHAILKQVLPQAFVEYDNSRSVKEYIEKFRADHSDFEELRPLMRQIVAENPKVNDTIASLPRVYDEAKARKAAMLDTMKKELNLSTTNPVPAPSLSEEEILTKLEQRIAEKIKKRRSLSGTLTASQTTPISPADRQTPTATDKPMTEEEKMFAEMMASGPPSTNFLHGLDLAAAKR